jgi:23S rRNA A2030 N6-methylase RlmJ
MPRVSNRQLDNVGNLGDILKHAALVELAALLAGGRTGVSFVDTHTFQLHAPLPDRARWDREVDALAARHPAYGRYATLERASLEGNGDYRCSSGLVLDALRDRRACAVLGEANAASRAELSTQIAAERLADVLVVDDAGRVDDAARVPRRGALLVHVDPFRLTPQLWSRIAPALSAMSARSADTAFVLYRYSRNARAPWPGAPAGTSGPLIETRGGPHEVAAYASPGIAEAVRDTCAALGWAPRAD